MKRILPVLLLAFVVTIASAEEITFVSWNILNFPGSTGAIREPEFRTVLSTIGPDVVVAEEVLGTNGRDDFLDHVLNTLEPGAWAAGFFHDGYDTDRALFYRIGAVEVLDGGWLDTALRDIDWWLLRLPQSGETFRVYVMHLKASTGSDNEQKRLAEVTILRNNLDTLDASLPVLVAGDLNIYGASEPAYQKLLESGVGQLHDPIEQPGEWHDNASFAAIHTQSPRTSSFGGGATGGMDDRFDQILVTDDLLNDSGIELLPASYTAYGNDGAHFNTSLINGPNGVVPDSVAEAIHAASDHLPMIVTISAPVGTAVAGPVPVRETRLAAAPNPFNPSTRITFLLPESADGGPLSLLVYEPSGRRVRTLLEGPARAGEGDTAWDGTDDRGRPVSSGVYILRLLWNGGSQSGRLVLVR
ncbi:MAG: hypothetical protein JW958_01830 [Candidatus Eisenbacteria bacterium]|nr:hypothetical protein [Candidatus Eisenbacteria bacterium]